MSKKISKWSVFVSSTEIPERKPVNNFLKKYFEVFAFEHPNFPDGGFGNTHKVCIENAEIADIFVLLINNKKGGDCIGKRRTITEEEFQAAASKKNKIIVTLIHEKTWEEYLRYNEFFRQYKLRNPDFKNNNAGIERLMNEYYNITQSHYIERSERELLNFVHRVSKLDKGKNHYIRKYNENNLLHVLKESLSAKTPHIMKLLCEKQYKDLHTQKSIEGTYVEKLEIIGKNNTTTSCINEVKSKLKIQESIIIIGKPGVGKTTNLMKCYFNHYRSRKRKEYPFFVDLSARGKDFHFELDDYLEECFNRYFKREKFPLLNNLPENLYFYFDSFDELSDNMTMQKMNEISNSSMLSYPYVISCRDRYYEMNFRYTELYHRHTYVLTNWTKEDLFLYLDSGHISYNEDKIERLSKICCNRKETDCAYNPLLSVIFFDVARKPQNEIEIENVVALYQKYLSELAYNAVERSHHELEGGDLVKIWTNLAWEIFKRRVDSKADQIFASTFCNDYKLLEPMFDIDHEGQISKCKHESFMEHFITQYIMRQCIDGNESCGNCFKIPHRSETSAQFRIAYNNLKKAEREKVMQSLCNILKNNTKEIGENGNQHSGSMYVETDQIAAIATRVVDYHSTEYDILKRLSSECSDNKIKLSMLTGFTIRGDVRAEEQLYTLISDKLWDIQSNFLLRYYGDIDSPEYIPARLNKNWSLTYNRLEDHLFKKEYEHLHRIEILKIRKFIEDGMDKTVISWDKLSNFEHRNKQPLKEEFEMLLNYHEN